MYYIQTMTHYPKKLGNVAPFLNIPRLSLLVAMTSINFHLVAYTFNQYTILIEKIKFLNTHTWIALTIRFTKFTSLQTFILFLSRIL